MKEKVIIEGKINYQVKNFKENSIKLGVILTIVITILLAIWDIFQQISYTSGEALFSSVLDNFISYYWPVWFIWVPFLIVGVVVGYFLPKMTYTITVTEKNVRGVSTFGEKVDLPIDSISALGTTILKGIIVTSASGSIRFLGLNNRDEVYDAIYELMNKRNEKKTNSNKSNLKEELRDLKELLDEGIINQEEFDKKKKELLK